MAKYNTRQRELMETYLSSHLDEQLTAHQIAEDLGNDNISLSAVYRNLTTLEQEGKLWRCERTSSREVTYQYITSDSSEYSLHLSCRICGKRFHLDKKDADNLISSVMKNMGFLIDKPGSILYGICENCRRNEHVSNE